MRPLLKFSIVAILTTWAALCQAQPYVTINNPSMFPPGSNPITGNATGTTGAVVGTLTGVANATTYICGFAVSAVGTGAVGPITIAGIVTSSMVFQLTAAAAGAVLTQGFSPCIPSSAVNTNITVTTTADASASAVDVNSWGYTK
jgi:hypothetical protein